MKYILVGSNGVITNNGNALYREDDSLPEGLTRLQYISAAGHSAVNTEIVVGETDKIIVQFSLSNTSASGDKFIISGQANFNNSGYSGGGLWAETYNNTNTWYVRFGSSSSVSKAINSSVLSGTHTFELRKQYFAVDGSKILTPNYSSMWTGPVNIGGRITSATSVQGFYGNLYDTEIIANDGTYRWHGVPAKDSNNVAGLYDYVSNRFFTSPATAFTAGPVAS